MKPILIIVSGGTASGKTTVVNEIISKFDPKDVSVIRHDDYYARHDELSREERRKVNYDHPSSLDNELLFEHLQALLNGESIDKPIYNFVVQNRCEETEKIYPTRIIILEGILALENSKIRKLASIKIYVESDDDIRFIRRLKRDMVERGRALDNIIDQYLTTVKPMFEKYVKPTKRHANIIIPNDEDHKVAVSIIASNIKELINNKED